MTTVMPMGMTRIGSYDEDEVRVLVEEYEELMDSRSRAFVHVRLMDLEQAMKRLSPKERQAVYLHGQLGLSTRSAGRLLKVSKDTVWRRYNHGLAHLVTILNGGR